MYTALDAEKFERFFAEPSFGTALASSVPKIRQVITGSNIELQIIEPEAAAAAAANEGGPPSDEGLRSGSQSGDGDAGAAAAAGASTAAAAGEPKTASAVAPEPAPPRKQTEQKQVRGGRCVLCGGRLD
eukprot:COSAG01_NODE_2225_length_8134_cov_4.268326_7_plen_129_part_00